MEKEFIPYEQALSLKELGFDEPCLGYWRNEDLPKPLTLGQYTTKEDMEYEISGQDEYHNFKNIISLAPTFSQAFRWFREKYNIDSMIQPTYSTKYQYRMFHIEGKAKVQIYGEYMGKEFKTYEEAELECLKKLIEIINKKQVI